MYGAGESIEFLSVELADGPEHVTEALQLAAGSRLIRRARLIRGSSGRPIELSTSWFDGTLAESAPGLLKPERLVGGTAKYIADVAGRTAEYVRDQVAARLATDDERHWLELPTPSAVLEYLLVIFSADDQPLQCDEATYAPNQWTFRQEYRLA